MVMSQRAFSSDANMAALLLIGLKLCFSLEVSGGYSCVRPPHWCWKNAANQCPPLSPPQYQLNGQMSRMEPCLMGSTPRLHPAPVAPRWPDVSPANSCYTSPPMHSSRYAAPGDMYSTLVPRRNSEYEHSQHFPGFAYINGEATTGWAK